MKKSLCGIVFVLAVLLVTGCQEEKKEILCNLTSTQSTFTLNSEYIIYATGKNVDSVKTVETVTSDDADTLDYFEETLQDTYDEQNEAYGGYDVSISNDGKKVVATTIIDYNKMDLTKYAEDNTVIKQYLTDNNKLSLDGVISIYESMGAVCEK